MQHPVSFSNRSYRNIVSSFVALQIKKETNYQVKERLIDSSSGNSDEVSSVSVPDDTLAEFRKLELICFRKDLRSGGTIVISDWIKNVSTLKSN